MPNHLSNLVFPFLYLRTFADKPILYRLRNNLVLAMNNGCCLAGLLRGGSLFLL